MSERDGGPAFPQADKWNEDGTKVLFQPPDTGMTLRDFFAAAALQGMMSRDSFDPGQASPTQRAHLAYIDADAMLAQRAK